MSRGFPSRLLDWEGCFNARALGGGGLVRSESLDYLTEAGWRALREYGIRTIVDLREPGERTGDWDRVSVPLDDRSDEAFWSYWATGPQFGTPLYYRPFLERKAERGRAVLEEIAGAPPGGVLFHCGGGRDRTGLISILLLAIAGFSGEDIAADYELSYVRMPAMYRHRGEADQGPALRKYLRAQGTTARQVVLELLNWLDVPAQLGLGERTVGALRQRVLGG